MSESLWTLEDGELHICLAKGEQGATWASAVAGHELQEQEREGDQKRLLLERFQEEARRRRGARLPGWAACWPACWAAHGLLQLV